MVIKDPGLVFSGTLLPRHATNKIILHHYASPSTTTPADVHRWHLTRDGGTWAGFGYNFAVDRDGTVWLGRGWDNTGAHVRSMNSTTLGIACQGNFDVTEMPEPQFAALVELLQEARRRYGKIPIVGHRDVAATACPGNYFPLAEVVSVVDTLEKRPAAAALDSLNLQIDGLNLQLEGINVNGRIFAPARALLEATGRKVSWDEKTRTVIARLL